MKHLLVSLFTILSIYNIAAQQSQDSTKVTEPKTLQNEFNRLNRISTTYRAPDRKRYKVISEEGFLDLKKQVLDSVNAYEKIISEKEIEITNQKNTIIQVKQELKDALAQLEQSKNKENSISILGYQISKSTYNISLWGLVVLFLILSISFLVKYRNSNEYTKEAKARLLEIEEELEQFRKKSLVREQKLRRQLQDEINKQK